MLVGVMWVAEKEVTSDTQESVVKVKYWVQPSCAVSLTLATEQR